MLRGLKEFKLPEIEEKVLKFWKEKRIFEKSLQQRQGTGDMGQGTRDKGHGTGDTGQGNGKDVPTRSRGRSEKPNIFRFFEGPPYANGKPGIHHVLARVFKDVMLRYKSMRGYYVPRRAGWDTHGLPVEIEVEKQLGIKSKKEIEKLGIALFNQKAKEAVWKYKDEWEKMTERIGYWLDLKDAYVTYSNDYIESLWWILKEIWKRGYLKKLYKVAPWCTRCETALSSHELSQPGGYQRVKDPSVFVKFEIRNSKSERRKTKEYLLVWTTTPWTLPANMAVAVHPGTTYTKYKIGNEYLWSAIAPPKTGGEEAAVMERISGKKLVGTKYVPPYPSPFRNVDMSVYRVMGADFVNTNEGTGIVHVAPAFGEDDLALWKTRDRRQETGDKGLDIFVTVNEHGTVLKGFPGAGKFIKDADKDIVADLRSRGLLLHEGVVEHEYPFCWRCSSPLIYFARSAWFIEMSRLRKELVTANKGINWIPAHIKDGRFGEWIKEAKDWALSRERYWGTPLPIWECANSAPPREMSKFRNVERAPLRMREASTCDNVLVIGGLAELNDRAPRQNRFFFVRHGEAESNVRDFLASGPEKGKNISRLTPRGKEQAKALGEHFKKIGVDAIFCSPYLRTRETARAISKATGVKVVVDKRLSEVNGGVFNGRPEREYRAFFEHPIEKFTKAPPGGETLRDVKRRMLAFARDANSRFRGKTIVVVSHADLLWVGEAALKGLSETETFASHYPEVGEATNVVVPNWPFDADGNIDLHRPYVDAVALACPACKRGEMRRVPEVADVWFDSGAMPFAQWHYPFARREMIDRRLYFPADYIAEGIDQTRGWFYTLLAIATLLGRGAPYRNAVSLGLILDKHGQKMSKSKGNAVEPFAVIRAFGADVVRWHFFTASNPGEAKRFDETDLAKAFRRVFLILYNSFVFFATYADKRGLRQLADANKRGKTPGTSAHALDRWIVARTGALTAAVTSAFDRYDVHRASRAIEEFTDDLSRWYIRRSRDRMERDPASVAPALGHALLTLAKLLAPFAPFMSEALHGSLRAFFPKGMLRESVHLEDWPLADRKSADPKLVRAMHEVRRLASAGLAARAEAKIRVRQPLNALKIRNPKSEIRNSGELLELLRDEVNVKEIVFDQKIKTEVELDTVITPELKQEGILREFARMTQELRREAGCTVRDRVAVTLVAPRAVREAIEASLESFKRSVGARAVQFADGPAQLTKSAAQRSAEFEGEPFSIGIRKVR